MGYISIKPTPFTSDITGQKCKVMSLVTYLIGQKVIYIRP